LFLAGPEDQRLTFQFGNNTPTPHVLRKSVEAIESKRVPQHSWFQERAKSAEAIENREVISSLSCAQKQRRRVKKKRSPTPPTNLHDYQTKRLTKGAVCKRLILKGVLPLVRACRIAELAAKKKSGSKAAAFR
jgi:hypothetical protein